MLTDKEILNLGKAIISLFPDCENDVISLNNGSIRSEINEIVNSAIDSANIQTYNYRKKEIFSEAIKLLQDIDKDNLFVKAGIAKLKIKKSELPA